MICWPCSVCATSGWNCVAYRPRSGCSIAATAVVPVRAVTTKPSGAVPTESRWLIQTCQVSGRPSSSWQPGAVTVSSAKPYSPMSVFGISPPRCSAISWMP